MKRMIVNFWGIMKLVGGYERKKIKQESKCGRKKRKKRKK